MRKQDRFEVILVEPADSLNIGAAARAMSNLGFSSLTLVAPRKYRPRKAAVAACWAAPLLAQVRILDSLEVALGGANCAIAFSARDGKNRPTAELLPQWARSHCKALPNRTALVFGPEDHGLTLQQLELCSAIVRIPSSAENPSLNLAQAVLLVLYELSCLLEAPSAQLSRPVMSEQYALDRQLEQLLERCGFYNNNTPQDLPTLVKLMFHRIQPDERELQILQGIVGTIRRKLGERTED